MTEEPKTPPKKKATSSGSSLDYEGVISDAADTVVDAAGDAKDAAVSTFDDAVEGVKRFNRENIDGKFASTTDKMAAGIEKFTTHKERGLFGIGEADTAYVSADTARGAIPFLAGAAAAGIGYALLEPINYASQKVFGFAKTIVTGGGYLSEIPVIGKVFELLGDLMEGIGKIAGYAVVAAAGFIGYSMFSSRTDSHGAGDRDHLKGSLKAAGEVAAPTAAALSPNVAISYEESAAKASMAARAAAAAKAAPTGAPVTPTAAAPTTAAPTGVPVPPPGTTTTTTTTMHPNGTVVQQTQTTAPSGAAAPTGASPTGTTPTGAAPTGTAPTGTAPTGTTPTGTGTTAASGTAPSSGTAAPTGVTPPKPLGPGGWIKEAAKALNTESPTASTVTNGFGAAAGGLTAYAGFNNREQGIKEHNDLLAYAGDAQILSGGGIAATSINALRTGASPLLGGLAADVLGPAAIAASQIADYAKETDPEMKKWQAGKGVLVTAGGTVTMYMASAAIATGELAGVAALAVPTAIVGGMAFIGYAGVEIVRDGKEISRVNGEMSEDFKKRLTNLRQMQGSMLGFLDDKEILAKYGLKKEDFIKKTKHFAEWEKENPKGNYIEEARKSDIPARVIDLSDVQKVNKLRQAIEDRMENMPRSFGDRVQGMFTETEYTVNQNFLGSAKALLDAEKSAREKELGHFETAKAEPAKTASTSLEDRKALMESRQNALAMQRDKDSAAPAPLDVSTPGLPRGKGQFEDKGTALT